jgi:hypothetical protein
MKKVFGEEPKTLTSSFVGICCFKTGAGQGKLLPMQRLSERYYN